MDKVSDINCKFSIICPVYNAGKYLNVAIESVLLQSYIHWELILIDDGSTDDSGDICNDYAKRDQRIRVFHEKNQGVSAARNAGIEMARGNWILFLDSDDYFEKDALHILNNSILDKEVDMLIFNYYIDIDDVSYKYIIQSVNYNGYDRDFIESRILPGMLNTCDLKKENQINVLPFVWNKAYKREILEKSEIFFNTKLKVWEDKIFWLLYMKNIKNVLFVDDGLYHYVQSKKERLSGKYDSDIFENVVMIYNIMKDNFGTIYNMDSNYSNEYYYNVIKKITERIADQNSYKDFYIIIKENLHNPQIEKWIMNSVSETRWKDIKRFDLITKKLYFRMKLRKKTVRIKNTGEHVLRLLKGRKK